MSDPRNVLKGRFEPAERFDNFGPLLMRMSIHGFRSHASTVINIGSPVTAFSGLNGVGKSTILQLAAVAYKRPGALRNYRLAEFLANGPLDPHPFRDDARAEFEYWQSDRSHIRRTVSWNDEKHRWRYPRSRPERPVFFAGVGLYLPRVEQRDLIVRNARLLSVSGSTPVDEDVRKAICGVLGFNYDALHTSEVSYQGRQSEVAVADRNGTQYSESHMGFGEGRIQYLIRTIETLPDRALVLIEEPETSLHVSAQRRFGSYLVNVASRKGHQILLTTHSEYLLRSLPTESRVYLRRHGSGIVPIVGMTAMEMVGLMAEGESPALHVLVEDACAGAVVAELIRRVDPEFLSVTRISVAGGVGRISETLKGLASTGLAVAAVLDGDQDPHPAQNRFALPGESAPEIAMFESPAVAGYVQSAYGLDLDDFRSTLEGVDHHDWFSRLALRLRTSEEALTRELARVYASEVPETDAHGLVTQLRQTIEGGKV